MGKSMHHDTTTLARYVPDLTKDKVHVWLTKYHWTSNVIVGIILYANRWLALAALGVFARSCSICMLPDGELDHAYVGDAAICDQGSVDE